MLVLRRLALAVSMFLCLSVSFTAAVIATDAHVLSQGSIGAKGGGGGGGRLPGRQKPHPQLVAGFPPFLHGPPPTGHAAPPPQPTHTLPGPTPLPNTGGSE